MGTGIVTEYPFWFVIFCLIFGFIVSGFLYYKDNKLREVSKRTVWFLMFLRFVFISFLAFLLLSPLIKSVTRIIDKPLILFVQDNSGSVILNKDSSYYKNEYPKQVINFIDRVSGEYDVDNMSFGSDVSNQLVFEYNEKETNFTNLFNVIEGNYANRNIGAVILATDGIFNRGISPLYASSDISFPVYSLALGDTTPQKDIILRDVKTNKIAFLGNKFPVQALVEVVDLKGASSELNIIHKNESVFSKKIDIDNSEYSQTVNVELTAEETGIQKYVVRLSGHPKEMNRDNNTKTIVIDVIDSKQKVLILSNSPHPDIGAIKSALAENKNLEVVSEFVNSFRGKVKEYNLVIFHQLPSAISPCTRILSDIMQNRVPSLFVLGSQSALNNLNNLKAGLYIQQKNDIYNEVQPLYNESFSLFDIDRGLVELLQDAPPLIAPFGNYKIHTGSEVLFHQKIRNIETTHPLICFKPELPPDEVKTGFIAGEGIWRWRLYDYKNNLSHQLFDRMINKIVQYMALKVRKDNFVLQTQNVYKENERVYFDAEVYNQSFEFVDDAKVTINIYNEQDKKFTFDFSLDKSGTKKYFLNAGVFPVGEYRFTAKASHSDNKYTKSGRFTILSINIESQNTIANHRLLNYVSVKNGGKLFYPNQMDSLYQHITENSTIAPVSYPEKKLMELINLKWLFFVLLLFITVEWGLRKYFGNY